MAQTIQLISQPIVKTAEKSYSAHSEEPEPEDTLSIMLSLCNSANNLCITLEKVDHVLKMKMIELGIKLQEKGEAPSFEGDDLYRRSYPKDTQAAKKGEQR